ncbi:MAG: hypothetical protein EBT38_05635 [Acidimicrobiia bacterium]|nr:hypothetical protein [Acidimicrobiia bacterium]
MSALQCVCVSAALLAVLIGYVLGSIPVADFVARRAGAPNLRDVGDHNPGFWNSRSVLTRNQSLVVFVGDLLKGELAAVTDAEAKSVKAPAGVEPKQFAAWTTVARVLLNLDETITRE